ncbi:MAG: hypothetical protein KF819_14755 [Labilithrix sp.]|nr:hypothetical protein [Labilithrix sp.]
MIDAALLSRILRSPADVARACRADRDVAAIARNALVTIVVSAALFGATVGSWRGGRQILFSAMKMPVGLVGTLALSIPAFYALAAVFGRPWPLRAVLSLALVGGARFSLSLLAMTPLLWLTIDFGAPYHAVKLVAVIAYALAGVSGLEVLVRGLGDGEGKRVTITLFVAIFTLLGAQNAWILRPYLGRPSDPEPPLFTREREGGVIVQVVKSLREIGSKAAP